MSILSIKRENLSETLLYLYDRHFNSYEHVVIDSYLEQNPNPNRETFERDFNSLLGMKLIRITGKPLVEITVMGILFLESEALVDSLVVKKNSAARVAIIKALVERRKKDPLNARIYGDHMAQACSLTQMEVDGNYVVLERAGLLEYNSYKGFLANDDAEKWLKAELERELCKTKRKQQEQIRMSELDKKTIKLSILRAVKNSPHGKAHKFNVLGATYQRGALEFILERMLTEEERGAALRAFNELVSADRLRLTMDDLIDKENWVCITDHGESALSLNSFEEDEGRFIDPQTNLPLLEQFEQDFIFQLNQGLYTAISFIDMDNLKALNESLGHDSADIVICKFAESLSNLVRPGVLYRRKSSGDEFLILFSGVSKNQVEEILNKALVHIRSRRFTDGELSVTFSAGIASTEDSMDLSELKKLANNAMYHSKNNGKNSVTCA